MASSNLISALCAQHQLVVEALAATRRAVIITSATGIMLLCTEPAERCLERYFEDDPLAVRRELPEALRAWLRAHKLAPAGNGQPQEQGPPMIVDGTVGRLTVHLLASPRKHRCLLLLEEQDTRPETARFQAQLGLTAREAEILFWVTQGKMNGDIAILLDLRIATVEKHLEHIFAKLDVENRTAAARCAHEVLNGPLPWWRHQQAAPANPGPGGVERFLATV